MNNNERMMIEIEQLVKNTITRDAEPIKASQLAYEGDRLGLADNMSNTILELFKDERFTLKLAFIVSEHIEYEALAWNIIDCITQDEDPI